MFKIATLIRTISQTMQFGQRPSFLANEEVTFNYIFNELPSLQGHIDTLNLLQVHYMNR